MSFDKSKRYTDANQHLFLVGAHLHEGFSTVHVVVHSKPYPNQDATRVILEHHRRVKDTQVDSLFLKTRRKYPRIIREKGLGQ